jgi:hypothetical protein
VNGKTVASQAVKPGRLNLQVLVGASDGPREIEWRWSTDARISSKDSRQAAALLEQVAIAGATQTTATTARTTPSGDFFAAALSARQEVPKPSPVDSGRSGTFGATLVGSSFRWHLTTTALSGPIVAAVIHLGASGAVGARFLSLCQPCAAAAHGTLTLSSAEARRLLSSDAYVNVGTTAAPSGEIRGAIRRS